MYQAGIFLDLPIIDHLIIYEDQFYSFTDSEMLRKISRSKKYVLPFKEEEERIRKLGEKIGEKNKAVVMAKILKKRGISVELIAEASGLTKEQIEKL